MKKLNFPQKVILFCDGSKCGKDNKLNRKLMKGLIKQADLKQEVQIIKTQCTDNCKCAPVVGFQPQNEWFGEVSESKITQLFDEYILNKEAIKK